MKERKREREKERKREREREREREGVRVESSCCGFFESSKGARDVI